MKIEKVNDRQIRCTLTREDLANRELKISELAYGTEKAKRLFHDMMKQASYEFGFDAEDIPLMIEAVPLNSECIVLIITKVEDPEELDTRFSKFAPSIHDTIDEDTFGKMEELSSIEELPPLEELPSMEELPSAAKSPVSGEVSNEISNLFQKIEQLKNAAAMKHGTKENSTPVISKVFYFSSLSRLIRVAGILANEPLGANTLYQRGAREFLLCVTMGDTAPTAFAKICNILSEYGDALRGMPGNEAYFEEHCTKLITDNALETLSKL